MTESPLILKYLTKLVKLSVAFNHVVVKFFSFFNGFFSCNNSYCTISLCLLLIIDTPLCLKYLSKLENFSP